MEAKSGLWWTTQATFSTSPSFDVAELLAMIAVLAVPNLLLLPPILISSVLPRNQYLQMLLKAAVAVVGATVAAATTVGEEAAPCERRLVKPCLVWQLHSLRAQSLLLIACSEEWTVRLC
jgi:hypothetical protein